MLFKADSIQDAATLAEYVEAVRDGFVRGELTLAQGQEVFTVSPRGLIAFTVEGKAKGVDRKLKMTFRWKEKEKDGATPEAPLIISS